MATSPRGFHPQPSPQPSQDAQGLNDFQKSTEPTLIPIQRVGIEGFRLPITTQHPDGSTMSHDAQAALGISLPGGKMGVNMSRFCSILQEEAGRSLCNIKLLQCVLRRLHLELRDAEDEPPVSQSFFDLQWSHPLKQNSLRSKNWGWQYYDVAYHAQSSRPDGPIDLTMQVQYIYSSTCPCSLSLAKQYEQDYRAGKTKEGRGIATPHSQRSRATIHVVPNLQQKELTWDNLISLLRQALPTETQSLVKRTDEQAFTILNGEHPMFVEQATRRLSQTLNGDKRIADWQAKVEHLESLHSHNAVAVITKNECP